MAYDSLAYDLSYDDIDYSLFEPRSNAAPAYVPQKRKVKNPVPKKKIVEMPVKEEKQAVSPLKTILGSPTAKQLNEMKLSFARAAVFFVAISVFFGLISALIMCRVTIDTVSNDNLRYENLIEVANSENVRLNTELDAMFSPDKIEDYAVNTLGMVKLENYKVAYFDFSEGDKVVLSGNREYKK